MDRRQFLKASAAGAAASSSLSASGELRAEGYRRCDQIHEKLTPANIDKFTRALYIPEPVPSRPLTELDPTIQPSIGGGSQGVAPEFFWSFAHLTDQTPGSGPAPGDLDPRPTDICRRLDADGNPVPLQFVELYTKEVVQEVVPGWWTKILCRWRVRRLRRRDGI